MELIKANLFYFILLSPLLFRKQAILKVCFILKGHPFSCVTSHLLPLIGVALALDLLPVLCAAPSCVAAFVSRFVTIQTAKEAKGPVLFCQHHITLQPFTLKGSPSVSHICLRLTPTTSSAKQEAAVKSCPTFPWLLWQTGYFFSWQVSWPTADHLLLVLGRGWSYGVQGRSPNTCWSVPRGQKCSNGTCALSASVCVSVCLNHVLSLHL